MSLTIIKFKQDPTYSDIARLGANYDIDDVQLVSDFRFDPPRIHKNLYILYRGVEYPISRTYSCVDIYQRSTGDNVIGFTEEDIKLGRDYTKTAHRDIRESSIHRAYIIHGQ